MTDFKSYLAEKYMSGAKADAILARVGPQKKKKRKAATSNPTTGGAIIRDEDAAWGIEEKDEVDEAAEAVVASDRGFKKRRIAPKDEGSGWTTLQEGIKKEESPPPADDEQPVIVDNSAQTPFVGGLVTASQLKKALPSKADTQTTATAEEIARAQETVYRDATGRKIDTKAARAEAARLKREREEKEAQKMEWGKGHVQKEEQEQRRLELQKQQGKAFRHADDEDLNEEQKAKELWNDPAAAFLTKTRSKGPRKPEYSGPPPPPNRFAIKPGYRWDGVDRGNGFEKKLFASKNERRRKGAESYQWSVDDM